MKTNNDYEILHEACPPQENEIEERFTILIQFLLEHDIITEYEYLSFIEEI